MSARNPETIDELAALLRPEHELLGADFSHNDVLDLSVPSCYGTLDDELAALNEGVALSDLSGISITLLAGAPADSFCSAAFAAPQPAVGRTSFSAVLTGDGALASVGLLAHTGDGEFLCFDGSDRAELLYSWIDFLAHVEQNGVVPFEGLELADASAQLLPLLLAGPDAARILSDYCTEGLPETGCVASVMLDQIRCLVVRLPDDARAGYLILVPPAYARILWRSFLSFGEVTPVGSRALTQQADYLWGWHSHVSTKDRLEVGERDLRSWGLIRSDMSFVGARGLAQLSAD